MKELLANILVKGGVAVIPTDTIYGVVGQAANKETVERIYQIKGRKPEKPFIILISSIDDLSIFELELDPEKIAKLSRVWPGAVSVILPCTSAKFKYLHRGTNSLAFRLPNKKQLTALIKATGPLVAPSANPEGLEPAKNTKEAQKYFGPKVDTYVDGGTLVLEPSTLIDWTRKAPSVIRGVNSILQFLN